MKGPIETFLTNDHERLDGLLCKAVADPEHVDLDGYSLFRAGLLKHIGMEEKILLPAAARLRGGEALPIASRLRLDHGAIAALLVPSPAPRIVETLRAILLRHNMVEEGSEGMYAVCDRLAVGVSSDLLEQLRATPDVPTSPCNNGPKVMPAVARALCRAGYDVEADRLLAI